MDRVAIVTGGNSGIGRAIATSLARRDAAFVETDATREADVARMVATTLDCFGRLDFAVTGVALPVDGGWVAG